MSSAVRSRPGAAEIPLLRRALSWPWCRVVLLYAGSRAYSTLLLLGLIAAARALHLPFIGIRGRPSLVTVSGSWDGWFYRSIAEHGYPVGLPTDAAGHVLPNPWAFLPLFPLLERGVTAATGMSTFAAGAVIALAAGGGTAVLLERLLRPAVGERRALAAVALFAFGPLGFLLQTAYAESLFLLLLMAALLAMRSGRYRSLTALIVLAAFTRPGAIALPAVLALRLVLERRTSRERPKHPARAVVALVVGGAACVAWPLIADLVTGRHGTYLQTELSWWTGWVGRPAFVPFTPWFLITSRWLGPAGVLLAVLLAGAAAVWLWRGSPKELGGTIRGFSAVHLLYLVAVFLPQFSLPRLLMPLAPLLGASAFTGTPARRRRWLIAAVAMQPVCLVLLWFLSYP